MFGDEKDWQLQQAVNHLQGKPVVESKYRGKPISVVKKLKAEEKAQKKADEAKAKSKAQSEDKSADAVQKDAEKK